MNKILLIASSVYTFPPEDGVVLEGKGHKPLGILSLAAYMNRKGDYEVVCVDQKLDDPIKAIERYHDQLLFIGVSAMSADYAAAKEILAKTKAINPDLPCIIGGPHASAAYRETVLDGFDIVVIGEGETICKEIADIYKNISSAEQRRSALTEIQSIAFRSREDQVVVNPRKEFITDLDQLPFMERSYLPSPRYSRTQVTMVTSRGCPGKCFFCQSGPTLFGHKIRQRSVRHVIEEIRHLIHEGCHFITFLDDCLLWNEPWVHEFCDSIKRDALKFTWTCETRAQYLTESVTKKIIEAGCRGVNIGFESGSDSTLHFLQKGTNVATYKKAVDTLHRYGLQFHSYIIIGSPHETKADIENTVQFVKYARPAQIAVSRLTPIYGSKLFDYLSEKKLLTDVSEQTFYQNRYPIKCDHLTVEDLDNAEVEIYRAMYLPGTRSAEARGRAFLFDDPVPPYMHASIRYQATLRVRNATNFHWIAYAASPLIPLEELQAKVLRDNFYQQIEGKRILLYFDWFDKDHKHICRDYAGHLVGNVPMGEYGTFAIEYTAPDSFPVVFLEYNLFLPDENRSLSELGHKSFRRAIKIDRESRPRRLFNVERLKRILR